MGIIILVILALGCLSAIRAVVVFIKPRIKAKSITHSVAIQSAVPVAPTVLNCPNWKGFETPAFIRRGLSYPKLTEKKQKRVRKAKTKLVTA